MVHLLLAVIYISFISLGLPDALLGSAWPIMYQQFEVSVSYAGIIFMTIAAGTIVSSLLSDRLTRRMGTGLVTAISVAVTAVALWGFSVSNSFWMLLLWAVPYGLGAGGVDASINNYVAIHYSSSHMSWLHCMWGLGATIGPSIMGYALSGGLRWNMGYRYISFFQLALTAVLFISLPLWKGRSAGTEDARGGKPLSLKQIWKIPGAKEVMVAFFCYCGLEQVAGLWASSYLVLHKGIPEETAASFASLFFIGITLGRGLNGFLTYKFSDTQLVRLGEGVILVGAAAMMLPLGEYAALAGLVLVGLGCAPIYPCIIHSTPNYFGQENSQAVIGVQMASAYLGTLSVPAAFGLVANHISISLLPVVLLAVLGLMAWMHEGLVKKAGKQV